MQILKNLSRHALIVLITLILTGVMGEVMLRIKNSSQQNYVIEMWRYARELKRISDDKRFGHVHIPNSQARLQNTDIAINSLGMRGPEVKPGDAKKILILGSSITLGWGVPEEKTLAAQLQQELGDRFQVLNGGVGNYNLSRSVAYFKEHWRQEIKPDLVILNYFINDAEYLGPSADNFIFRNSQLAVTLYHVVQGMLKGSFDMTALIAHYTEVYRPDSKGYQDMLAAMKEMKEMADRDGFLVIFSMIPDVHQLRDYPFGFIHERMKALSEENNWPFVDLFIPLKEFEGPELWTIPGDPHPNDVAHGIMARHLAPYIK